MHGNITGVKAETVAAYLTTSTGAYQGKCCYIFQSIFSQCSVYLTTSTGAYQGKANVITYFSLYSVNVQCEGFAILVLEY
jgi:hypothetical protein